VVARSLTETMGKARFQVLGLEPILSTPAEMAAYTKAEREKWAVVIRESGIKRE
jgi:tripartite-type tricarboxylate transporter receptor subunit TctC